MLQLTISYEIYVEIDLLRVACAQAERYSIFVYYRRDRYLIMIMLRKSPT